MTGWIWLSVLDYRMSLYCIKQRDDLQKMSIKTERQVKQSLEKTSKPAIPANPLKNIEVLWLKEKVALRIEKHFKESCS